MEKIYVVHAVNDTMENYIAEYTVSTVFARVFIVDSAANGERGGVERRVTIRREYDASIDTTKEHIRRLRKENPGMTIHGRHTVLLT